MTSITTPSNQKVSVDPYSSKLFDFDNVSSKIYLARSINNLLNVFGHDVILDGITPTNLLYDSNTETVSITIPSGRCIIDTTLIEFPESTNLDLNCSGFDDNGSLLVFVSFKFTESTHNNTAKFKLLYLDTSNRYTYPDQIENNLDRIILAQLKFNKANNTVSLLDVDNITIASKSFPIYPLTNIVDSAKLFVRQLFN